MKKILVVDGNSILNRAFYGIRPLSTKDGLPTNAVYGMYTIISKDVNRVNPDYCVVAFDLKAPTFRHKMYDGYKANRKGMPEELALQLPYAKECMKAMGFKVIELEGYEADDILGTVSAKSTNEGVHSYLLTGDRDSLQLINDTTTVLLATNKETLNFDRQMFNEKYGVDPTQFVDVKALMGDSSDNIPGVAGIGEKTAFKLIGEFTSLDNLYSEYKSSKLTDSVKHKLEIGEENAKMSKVLATIVKDAPIDFNIEKCAYDGINKADLKSLFEKLEFFALIKKLGLDKTETVGEQEAKKEDNFNKTELNRKEVTVSELTELIKDKIASVSFENENFLVCDGRNLFSCNVANASNEEIEKLLNSFKVIAHDAKSLYEKLSSKGIIYRECYFDTMLASYVLNSTRHGYGIFEVYMEYMGKTLMENDEMAVAVYELYTVLVEKIKQENMETLLFDIEIPLAAVLADMELEGVKVDIDGIEEYGKELSQLANDYKERIYSLAGEEFNIDSHKQLGDVLFNKLGLPTYKKNKTGYSTDAEVLNKLLGKHDIIADILDYRQVTKLKSTYTDGIVKLADENGRIHSVFNQTGTATGRLSSAEPNLQNIPVRTELGRRFRKYFVPKSDDYTIIDADYSQIELRLLAAVSGDETMTSAYLNGVDIHTSTASKVFGVPQNEVTSELRKRAKAVNFGIVYGIGEYSLSEDLGISMAQAKKYIQSYLSGYPKVNAYLEDIKKKAREDGFVSTLFGRKRYIPELSVSNKNIQHFGERVAMNSPIQGTAADIIKIAMINTRKKLLEEGIDAKLILQVHDELLIESNKNCADRAMEILVEEMEGAVELPVPLNVEANMGQSWFYAKQ